MHQWCWYIRNLQIKSNVFTEIMDIYSSFSRTFSCSATIILTALSTCICTDAVPSSAPTDAMKLELSRKDPAVPAANPAELLQEPVKTPQSLKVKWMLSIAAFLVCAPYIPVGFFRLYLSYSTIWLSMLMIHLLPFQCCVWLLSSKNCADLVHLYGHLYILSL